MINFNELTLAGNEFEYMRDAIARKHTAGDGEYTRRCQSILEEETGAKKALLTTSCTHALEMAALLLNVKEGDEVIFPSFTFVSTVNAFVMRGITPVFVDIRRDTLNLDEEKLEERITGRTRAIVPVHYAGVGCEMDRIMSLAREHDLAVVEDNAHGLFGAYRGRPLGSFGCLATQSFHETKNCSCGEGGALLINDSSFISRSEIIREKGTDRSRFFRGEVDKYSWVDVGSSYLPSDILAAFLLAQLEAREKIQRRRKGIWNSYYGALSPWVESQGVRLPTVPEHCDQAYHMFYMLMGTPEERTSLITHLKENGILSVFHYLPLHLSEMGRRFGGMKGACPVTEDVSQRLLRLPFYNGLEKDDIDQVVRRTLDWKS